MRANVIKVTALKKGDIFKVMESGSYSEDGVYYGVVLDLFNTGEQSFMQVLRYKKSYGDVNAELVVYDGDKDLALFPATIEEVTEYFGDTIAKISSQIEEDKKKLQQKIEGLEKAKQFVKGELSKKLTEMSFEEVTQEQFEKEKVAKEEKLKELTD